MDSKEFNGTFWLTITGVITAFFSGVLVYAIKSKCTNCEVCYEALAIQRDFQVEFQGEKLELEKGMNPHTVVFKMTKI